MNVREAANVLGVSTAAIYSLCASRQLGHRRRRKDGGTIDITQSHIDAYLKDTEVPTVFESRRAKPLARKQRGITTAEVLAKHGGKR